MGHIYYNAETLSIYIFKGKRSCVVPLCTPAIIAYIHGPYTHKYGVYITPHSTHRVNVDVYTLSIPILCDAAHTQATHTRYSNRAIVNQLVFFIFVLYFFFFCCCYMRSWAACINIAYGVAFVFVRTARITCADAAFRSFHLACVCACCIRAADSYTGMRVQTTHKSYSNAVVESADLSISQSHCGWKAHSMRVYVLVGWSVVAVACWCRYESISPIAVPNVFLYFCWCKHSRLSTAISLPPLCVCVCWVWMANGFVYQHWKRMRMYLSVVATLQSEWGAEWANRVCWICLHIWKVCVAQTHKQ